MSRERCDCLLPTVVFCATPDASMAKKEYMFPLATVVECPQSQMLAAIGPTLAGTDSPPMRRSVARCSMPATSIG